MIPELPKHPPMYQLTTKECGTIAGRHPRTIVTWIRTGLLPARQMPGIRGQYRILFKDLRAVLEKIYVPQEEE